MTSLLLLKVIYMLANLLILSNTLLFEYFRPNISSRIIDNVTAKWTFCV